MVTQRSLENLKPWKKGQSGNPGGRRKDPLLTAARAAMTDDDAQAIVSTVIEQAKAGNPQFVQMLWDRLEGKAIARQEQGEPGEFEKLSIGAIRKALRVVS